MPTLFIGCSGFSYPDWRGRFYPAELAQKQWFAHYCSIFTSVELNVTFYRLLKSATFDHWRLDSPPQFTFSVKGSRFITHVKRLLDSEEPLRRFFDGVLRLEEKLGVVLWQFPPDFSCDRTRLKHFIHLLQHYPVRQVFEFRNEACSAGAIGDLCRDAGISLCRADWPPFSAQLPLTADFVYLRRHGRAGSYASCYSMEELEVDARRIREHLEDGRDVYIYFNNDYCAYAPRNALELRRLLET